LHKYKDLLDDSGNQTNRRQNLQKAAGQKQGAPSQEEGQEQQKPKTEEETTQDSFFKFRSCGIEEIKMKSMGEPGQYREHSVFNASKAQIEIAR